MARPLRIVFDGAWYHVMNRGVNRNKIFYNHNHRMAFLNYLNEITKIYGVEVHAYCLMGNHYHLIIHTPKGNISDAIKYLNSSYARYVNVSTKRDGPLFRGRFKSIVISEDEYLIRLSRYIHRNPIEANTISKLDQYKWSSYPSYIGINIAPSWLVTSEIITRFRSKNFVEQYKYYVECVSGDDLKDLYNIEKFPTVLGGDNFRQYIYEHAKSHSLSAEIVGADRILSPLKPEKIIRAVSSHFNLNSEHILKKSIGSSNPARLVSIYIIRELAGYNLNEIGKLMGGVTYKYISTAISRVKSDKEKIKIARLLINQLKRESKPIMENQESRRLDL